MGNLVPAHAELQRRQGMSQAEAQKIACFLLTNTATNPNPPSECAGK